VAHWLACIWYVIAQEEKHAFGDEWQIGEHYSRGCPFIEGRIRPIGSLMEAH
jgi:hypothetical protein